jgi:hypothetical protein
MARVKSELLLRECWEAVAGYKDTAGAQLSQTEIRKRAKENLTALAVIMRTVSDELINDIQDCNEAREAWGILDKVCNENTEYGAMIKLKELACIQKSEDVSMQDYCSKIMTLNRLLKRNDLGFSDNQIIYKWQ